MLYIYYRLIIPVYYNVGARCQKPPFSTSPTLTSTLCSEGLSGSSESSSSEPATGKSSSFQELF